MDVTIQSDLSVQALSETVKALRLARGDSQTTAAARIGVSVRSWQRMESADPQVAGQVALGDFLAALEVYAVRLIDLIAPVAMEATQAGGLRQRGRSPKRPSAAPTLRG
ncbi:helix-turn-helix transcriptional regulator [Variovorax sp. RTB1]|uniref:helix-turn-helix domain-containing protein n=1 Tax=Variovorax sp. RTB1 TaxID=3048631 RepID=UPI002B23E56A|nr:helix-turn-helix transcriptional regulator [Variovorax sp. RTB1]MEB0114739.1 helix-turn-helix transcriptional regulator [Variovorax sp. RTB1]